MKSFSNMYSSRSRYIRRAPKIARRTNTYRRRAPIMHRTRFTRAKPAAIMSYFPSLPTRGNMSKTGVPNTMSVQLKAIDNVNIAPAATYQVYSFKLNSANDPFGDASTVQPTAYDQVKALYGSSVVLSGAYKVTFANTTNTPCTIACYTSSSAVVGGGAADPKTIINNFCSQPGAVYKIMADADSGNVIAMLRRSFKCDQILGPLDRSSHGAAVDADPTTMAYLHVLIAGVSGTNITGRLYMESVQNTTFYDKKPTVDA